MTRPERDEKLTIPGASFLTVFRDYSATLGVLAVAAALLIFMAPLWLLEC
jgi:hypothetical protein